VKGSIFGRPCETYPNKEFYSARSRYPGNSIVSLELDESMVIVLWP